MNGLNFAAYVRRQTRTTAVTLPNDALLLYMNKAKDEIAGAIIEKDEDYFLVPQTTDLVADQREYPLPVSTANRIKRVEAKLDGVNWIKLKPVELAQYTKSNQETDITSFFTNQEGGAFYEILRFSIFLFTGTVPDADDALKLWAFDYPADILEAALGSSSDLSIDPSSTTFGIPRALHGVWAERVIIEWKNGQTKPVPLTKDEQNWEFRLQGQLDKLTPLNADEAFEATLPNQLDRGDSGFNY